MKKWMMTALTAGAFGLCASGSVATAASSSGMQTIRVDSVVPVDGPTADFSSTPPKVRPLFQGQSPSTLSAGSVTFQGGSRSAWHTHPKGQFIVVTAGEGLVQEEGKLARRVKAGDVIWTPPGVRHWHGATPESSFTQIAIQESEGGQNVRWMQKVTDGEYLAAAKESQEKR